MSWDKKIEKHFVFKFYYYSCIFFFNIRIGLFRRSLGNRLLKYQIFFFYLFQSYITTELNILQL